MHKLLGFALFTTLMLLISADLARTAGAEILITSDAGTSWDPIIGANPVNVSPSSTNISAIQAMGNPFGSPFSGPVQLQAECCKDMFTQAPVTPSGLSVVVLPYSVCRPRVGRFFPVCTTATSVTVNVTPGSLGGAFLHVIAAAGITPGAYIATIKSSSSIGSSSKDIFVNVLPASWPGDGPGPACPPGVTLLSLAAIDPFTWKRANLAKTSYTVAAAFTGAATGGGLQFTLADPGATTGPLPRSVAIVSFMNTRGWPVGMRTTNSRNCSAAGQQVTVAAGETKTFSFSTANTTTLVFSKSSCRVVNLFDCWGHAGLGLDDIVAFTEGPFWTLFGGRRVNIETVGDWGAIATPNSVATIRTQ